MMTLKKLLQTLGRYRLLLIASLLFSAAAVILQLYVPNLFGDAIDLILGPDRVDFAGIKGILYTTGILILISTLSTLVMNFCNNYLAYHAIRDLRARAIRKLQHLPLSFLDQQQSGDLVQRIIGDTDQISDGLLLGLTQLFSGVVTIVVTLLFMFRINLFISLVVVIMTPITFLVTRFISTRSYQMFKKQTLTRGAQTALISEIIGSQKLVKAFSYEEQAGKRFDALNEELKGYAQKAVFFSSLTNPSTRAVNNVIYALVALIGSYMILNGRITVGALSVMLYYANQYMKPFNDISSVITELQNSIACADRLFDLLEAPELSPDADHSLGEVAGDIMLDHVSFSYDKKRKLIEDVNLHVKPGMHVAIVGPTGCGKTTLINLLMRFYDTDAGRILIDDADIASVSRDSLRSKYGMVLQDTWIRSGTVKENITLGKPQATDAQIRKAAYDAHSLEFIRRLPQGFDTVIDENSLSQGEKQLLCITRVMLALPPMLILDEATSSIDTRTELHVQQAFEHMMQGRTSFIVAHRLSTIRSADLILVMKDGTIIEQGTHEELLLQGGFYKSLYDAQFAVAEQI